jgi:hypothetical protein
MKRPAFSVLMLLFIVLSLLSLADLELPSTVAQQSSTDTMTELYLAFC